MYQSLFSILAPGDLLLLEFSILLGPSENPWGPIEHVNVDNLAKHFE